MIQLANYEQRTFYIDLGEELTVVDLTLVFQMTDEHFLVRLTADKTNERATKFSYTATGLPEGQYLATFAKVDGTDLVTVAAFVTGDPIFATSQYNTYNDDGTSTTFVPSDDQGLVPSVSQRLRVKTEDDATDVHYVRTINVPDGTLTDDGNGEVTLDTSAAETLNDLTDVQIINPEQGDVLSYNSGVQKWMVNGGLQELLARFKASGTGAQVYDTLNDTTKGYIDILANSAKMKVNLSGLTVTEASPGVLSFAVAAGTEGNEVEFEAMTIEGSDAVSTVADINFKQGSLTYWENATGKIWLRAPNAGNITVLLPSSSGTLALTTDIPNVPVDSVNGQTGVVVLDTGDIDENGNLYFTDARVAANAAVVANTAKVGITTQQAADITANNAKVGITQTQADDITANNAKVGITPTQAGEITANTAKVGVIAGGTSGQALVKASGTDYDLEWADAASGVQYHERFATDAETFRSGATATTELYYTAKADGDGLAQSASSDTPTAGKIIKRKIYYSEAAFADPDTGTWVEFTPAPADDASFATVKAALLEYLKARTGGTVPISLKQTWEEVSSVQYLLDQSYGSGAAAAYSTRQLRFAQTDCMVIRRASDSTTTTIGFDGSGNIDEAAITTFCTGTTCTVSEWKDQSGNGNDATQSTSGNQPTIYTGGAIVKENGQVALDFDGVSDGFVLDSTVGSSSNFAFVINAVNSARTQWSMFSDSNDEGVIPIWQSGSSSAISHQFTISNLYKDSVNVGSVTRNDLYVLYRFSGQSLTSFDFANDQVGNLFNRAAFQLQGTSQEVVLYNSDKSTDRTDIEENIADYFTQNTPLLDTYSGAAAAYSLRLLDSTYTGSAVEVYNGSSYADIGFNVFGELDTVALASHCGSNNGFVSKFYDQSGNTNTAAQTTTSQMPKIYDGTTGVVTENGKPAVYFNGDPNSLHASTSISHTNSTMIVVCSVDNVSHGTYDPTIFRLGDGSTKDNDIRFMYGTSNRSNVIFRREQNTVVNSLSYTNSSMLNQNLTFNVVSSSNLESFMNGSSQGTQANTPTAMTSSSVDIGAVVDGTANVEIHAKIQEAIFYTVDQDSAGNRANIESNINTFYDIY